MGALFASLSRNNVPPGFDEPDQITTLTPRDKKHITDTWAIVQKDSKAVGMALFIKFFELYPQHQNYFKSFKNVPLAELPDNKCFRAHASNVIYSFTAIVNLLNDSEALVEFLYKIGENHSRRNISTNAFHDLKTTLLKLFEEQLGNKYTPEMAKSWEKTLDVAINTILSKINVLKE